MYLNKLANSKHTIAMAKVTTKVTLKYATLKYAAPKELKVSIVMDNCD